MTLIRDGAPDQEAMRVERVPDDDILAEARKVGIENIEEIKEAVLETTGSISIIPKQGASVTRGKATEKKAED